MATPKIRAEEKGKADRSVEQRLQIAPSRGEVEPEIKPHQRRDAIAATIELTSRATDTGSPSSAAYTCDAKDSWPALEWQGVPASTTELTLFVMNIQPVHERIFFDWALAGLDPKTSGLETGELPDDVVVGKNSLGENGYSMCPLGAKSETYMFVLYALPKELTPKQGFDPMVLREKALDLSGNAGRMAASYSHPRKDFSKPRQPSRHEGDGKTCKSNANEEE